MVEKENTIEGKLSLQKSDGKIVGKPSLFDVYFNDKLTGHGISYETILLIGPEYPDTAKGLEEIGIKVVSTKRDKFTVVLPIGWMHFRESSNQEYVVDPLGFKRLDIHPKEKLVKFKRFVDYECIVSDNPDLDVTPVTLTTLIKSYPVEETKINSIKYHELLREYNNDHAKVIEDLKKKHEDTITKSFPEWKNPLAYWNIKLS